MKKSKAFTLIEILVVIAIIGLLAGIALISVNNSRKEARDAQRKADLHQIHLALEMLYDDVESYTVVGESCGDYSTGCYDCGCPPEEESHDYGDWSPSASSLYRDLVPDYISELPIDPINNSTYHYYFEPNCADQGNCDSSSWSQCCEFYLCATRLETTGTSWCDDSFRVGP